MKNWSVLSIVVIGLNSEAALMAGWEINGVEMDVGTGLVTNVHPYRFLATTSDYSAVSAELTLGDGVNPTTSEHQYGFKIPGGTQTNSLAGAIDQEHYMEFRLSVDAGYSFSLNSIEMRGQASASGCSNVVLMSDIDGFSAGQEIASTLSINGDVGGLDTDASGFGGPIDLSDARYQNLTGAVTFRLYGWGSSSSSGLTYLRSLSGYDLEVFGEVEAVTASGELFLNLDLSNDVVAVEALFDGTAGSIHWSIFT